MTQTTVPISRADERAGSDRQVMGRYVLLQRLGQGATGTVYSAFDPMLDRRVAIKVLRSSTSASTLIREGRLLARLDHPAIVSVHDIGVVDGSSYLAMELFEQGDIAGWVGQEDEPRSVSQILDALVHAARGLEAAHACGIVHGDVKPENILVDERGLGSISDFGVARLSRAGVPDEGDERHRWVGTPAYMAPEQLEGRASTEASDQYGFCLTAWTLLTRTHPFGSGSTLAARDGTPEGRVSGAWEPLNASGRPGTDSGWPQGFDPFEARAMRSRAPTWTGPSDVPRRVVRALTRGLQVDPEARFPTMRALIDALEPSAWLRRRSIAALSGVGFVGMLVAFAVPQGVPCESASIPLGVHWSDEARKEVQSRLTSVGKTGEETWERVGPVLDRYEDDWDRHHRRICEATHVHKEQSGALLDLRMDCLERARTRFASIVAILRSADAEVASRSVRVVEDLDPLTACETLRASDLPERPQSMTADDIGLARSHLAQARALRLATRYDDALRTIERLREVKGALGETGFAVDSAWERGLILQELGRYEEARESITRSFELSLEHENSAAASQSGSGLAFVLGEHLERHDAAHAHARTAAALARAAGDTRLEADAYAARGAVSYSAQEYAASVQALQEAVKLYETTDVSMPRLASVENDLALGLEELGELERAEDLHRHALELRRQSLGPHHPDVAQSLQHLGLLSLAFGRIDEGIERFEHALKIERAARGQMHDRVGIARANLARGLAEAGRLKAARSQYERAIDAFTATLGPSDEQTLQVRASLSVVLSMQGDVAGAEAELRALLTLTREPHQTSRRFAMLVRYDLGSLLLEQNRLDEAHTLLSSALELAEQLFEGNTVDLAEFHHQLGVVLRRLGRSAEAREQFTAALDIWIDHEADHPSASSELRALALLAFEEGDDERALEFAERAWAAYQRREHVSPGIRARSMFLIARVLRRLGRDAQRQESLARAALDELESGSDPVSADFLPLVRSFLGD